VWGCSTKPRSFSSLGQSFICCLHLLGYARGVSPTSISQATPRVHLNWRYVFTANFSQRRVRKQAREIVVAISHQNAIQVLHVFPTQLYWYEQLTTSRMFDPQELLFYFLVIPISMQHHQTIGTTAFKRSFPQWFRKHMLTISISIDSAPQTQLHRWLSASIL